MSKITNSYKPKHLILPHPSGHRAFLLTSGFFALYIGFIGLFLGLLKLTPTYAPDVLGYASNINVDDLLNETNNVRRRVGLHDLVLNEKLSLAAEQKANDMFSNDYWAHVSPDGIKPWDFIVAQNYDYSYAGENLAKNFSTSDKVVTAWYNSTSHRENLINPNYDEIGFAVVNGSLDGYETTLVVQMFGRTEESEVIARQTFPDSVAFSENQLGVLEVEVPQPGINESLRSTSPLSTLEKQKVFVTTPVYASSPDFESKMLVNLGTAPRYLLSAFVMFLIVLLVVDIIYSRKKGILKFTGNTLAHILFLTFILFSIWYLLTPGKIL